MRMIQMAKPKEAMLNVGKNSKNIKGLKEGHLAVKGSIKKTQNSVVDSFKKSLAQSLNKKSDPELTKEPKLATKLIEAKKGKNSRDVKAANIISPKEKSDKKGKVDVKDIDNSSLAVSFINETNKPKEDLELPVKEGSMEASSEASKDVKASLVSQLQGDVKPNSLKSNNKINPSNITKESKADGKTQGKKSDKKLTVNDLRANNHREVPEAVHPDGTKINQDPTIQNSEFESSTEKTIVLGTTEVSAEGEGGKAQAPVMKEAAAHLKQQLKDFGNSEIVKNTRFILKDNNVGEIKLILKPESLGEVKINLNLNDNNLAGQIVVENTAVKEVFQENMSSLTKALESKGFDTANLDLSLSDKGEGRGNREQGENKQYFSDRLKKFEDSGRVVRYGLPTAGINLTA